MCFLANVIVHLRVCTVAHHLFSQKLLRGSLRGSFSCWHYSKKQPRLSLQCVSARLALLAVSRLFLALSDGSWLTGRKPRHTLGEPHSDSTFSPRQKEPNEWFDAKLNIAFCYSLECLPYLQYLLLLCFLAFVFSSRRERPLSLPVHWFPEATEAQGDASNRYRGNSDAQINTLLTDM